ncbi:MAG TPA: STAS domain-containing protein [Actinomycetota bacterium]|nr:STAS domain-containing protein [Actinomycetota bacterium]
MKRLDFQIEHDGDVDFRLTGELDLATADQLIQQLAPVVQQGREIRVDVSGLTFIDSTGLHAIAGLGVRCLNGGQIVILDPSDEVTKVLDLVGADRFPNVVIRDGRAPKGPAAAA